MWPSPAYFRYHAVTSVPSRFCAPYTATGVAYCLFHSNLLFFYPVMYLGV